MKKILVTGCNGQLGRAIRAEYANEEVTFINTDVAEGDGVTALDIADVDAVLAFAEEDRGRFSMGGMSAKLQAIREAVNAGTGVYMLHGRHPERIALLLEGKAEGAGTYFVPKG